MNKKMRGIRVIDMAVFGASWDAIFVYKPELTPMWDIYINARLQHKVWAGKGRLVYDVLPPLKRKYSEDE